MAKMTADQISQEWAQRLGASTSKIQAGVQSVTVAPGQAAARQSAVWLANLQASQGKWQRNTAAVSLQQWQQATIEKGVSRIASGANAAQPKFAAFMTQLLPHIDRVKGQLPARGNLDQNISRMTQFVRGMATFSQSGRTGQ